MAHRLSAVRAGALAGALLALLAGPGALAFFAGGYFEGPRAWAGLIAWALVVIALLARERPVPHDRWARAAIAGLGGLAAWTLLSAFWAPTAGGAYAAGQIAVLYTGALLAAAMLLRDRRALAAVEPTLAGGALVVIGYGISERLVPGALHFARSITAQGRLEQPLTYWNAMGEVAALGFVLSARLAGDAGRSPRVRIAAAAACAPLGMGLYLTFSRGALFACAAGLVALVVAAPTREQVRAGALAIVAGLLATIAAAPWGGVTSLAGTLGTRERQGAIALGLLALVALAAGAVQRRLIRHPQTGVVRLPGRAALIASVIIAAGLGVAVAVGAKEQTSAALSTGATRYTSLQSNRYAYWRVAIDAFAEQPLRGIGAGGWAVYWLRHRPFDDYAHDAHSLPLQTAAELGLVGVALLTLFLGGVALAGREAHRVAPALAAGPIAGAVVYVGHAPLDWDWEMPAVTLIGVVLAGALLALADGAGGAQGGGGTLGTSSRT